MLNPRWHVNTPDRTRTRALAEAMSLSPIVAGIMVSRGVQTVADAQMYLAPSAEAVSSPLLLSDMEKAVARVCQARDRGEAVRVFGDYDVDGIAGTAILLSALRRIGVNKADYGMPSRLVEGYGLSPEHVEAAQAAGVGLLITVDNGINAREAAIAAKALGVDLIVTDHHQLEGTLPDCCAIVNPKKEVVTFPGRELAGAAVAFKLAWALTGSMDDLDLAALGTVADIVPLQQENRVIAALGLSDMVSRQRAGLVQLAAVSGFDLGEVTAEKITFQLAPRLNAAGRLGDGVVPLELLLTDSVSEAAKMASLLNNANEERREIERIIFEDAAAEVEESRFGYSSIVLARRGWHPGVIGVVASRLHARFGKPVILIAIDENNSGRASARSHESFDMVAALTACQKYLVRFGGHRAAAGFSLEDRNIGAFVDAFEAETVRRLHDKTVDPLLTVDSLVSFGEIDARLVRELDRLEPFGCMNTAPIFCTCGVRVLPSSVRELRGGHLRFIAQEGTRTFPAIAFSVGDGRDSSVLDGYIDIAFTPRFNTFRGETTIQLIVKDIHSA